MNNIIYTEPNQRMIMNDEREGMRKEPVLPYFKILYKELFGGAEQNHQNFKLESQQCL
jgi:hypothetical protein